MINKKLKFILIGCLVILLAIPFTSLAASDSTSSTTSLKRIQLDDKSYADVKSVNLIPSSSGNVVSFTMVIFNGGKTDLQFVDYWARLQTKSGERFGVSLIASDADKKKIAAGTSQSYTLYTSVGNNVKLTDLVIQLIKWDFKQPSFEKVLGSVEIPASYQNRVTEGTPTVVNVAGQDVNFTIKRSVVNENVENNMIYINLEVANKGIRKVTIPKYVFHILTDEGILYQLSDTTEGLTLQPKESKLYEMNVTIPAEITSDKWYMVATMEESNAKIEIPIFVSQLNPSSSEVTEPSKTTTQFSTKNGTYSLSITQTQRMPWEDEDVIVTNLSLTNVSSKPLPIPSLSGIFEFDGISMDETKSKLISLDNIIGLQAGASANFILYVKIPYTYEFADLKVKIVEKDANQGTSTLAVFTDKANHSIQKIRTNETYKVNTIGKRAEIDVKNVYLYRGAATDMYYAEIEVTNKEKRATTLSKFEGYLMMADGTLYPAEVSPVKNSVTPNGKVLLAFASKIPTYYSDSNVEIIIGQGVKDNALAIGDAESDALINGAQFSRTTVGAPTVVSVSDMKANPYTMFISKEKAILDYDMTKFQLEFDYSLSKEQEYLIYPENHSLVIEVVSDKLRVEKEFHYEKSDGGDSLELGTGKKLSMTFEDPSLLKKASTILNYELNVYDKYNGHKRLIGTTTNWFVVE